MAIIKLIGIPHKFHSVDGLAGDQKKEEMLKVNPSGSLPTIIDGRFIILGGFNTFVSYLVNHHSAARKKFYPQEGKAEIDSILLWFQTVLMVCS